MDQGGAIGIAAVQHCFRGGHSPAQWPAGHHLRCGVPGSTACRQRERGGANVEAGATAVEWSRHVLPRGLPRKQCGTHRHHPKTRRPAACKQLCEIQRECMLGGDKINTSRTGQVMGFPVGRENTVALKWARMKGGSNVRLPLGLPAPATSRAA